MLYVNGMDDKKKIQCKKNPGFLRECHLLLMEWCSGSAFCCSIFLHDLGIFNPLNEKEEQGFICWNADPCGNAASDN